MFVSVLAFKSTAAVAPVKSPAVSTTETSIAQTQTLQQMKEVVELQKTLTESKSVEKKSFFGKLTSKFSTKFAETKAKYIKKNFIWGT